MSTPGTFLYFAFGSNLLTKRIHFQNPSAKSKGPARLDDYKLEFRYPSKRWGGCAATVTPSKGDHLWGVLWELENQHLATLDDQEGVHQRIYERIKLKVYHPSTAQHMEDRLQVTSYQVLAEKLHPLGDECRPSKVYKDVILEGAKENKLPEDYIKKLEALPHVDSSGDVQWGMPLHLQN